MLMISCSETSLQDSLSLQGRTTKAKESKTFKKWGIEENIYYINFLKEVGSLKFRSQFARRSNKIFAKMSQHIPDRNAEQCRTHHQKMIQSCKTIDKIIEKVQKTQKKKKEIRQGKNIMKKRGRKAKRQLLCQQIDHTTEIQYKNITSEISENLTNQNTFTIESMNKNCQQQNEWWKSVFTF